MTLAKRTFTSGSWKIGSNTINLVIVFIRSIVLARLLPVEIFGVFAFASSITRLSVILTDFGISGAFVHRSPETEDIDQAAAVQFTFRIILTLAWAGVLFLGTFLFTEANSLLRTALICLVVVLSITQLTSTPNLILLRKVQQRRKAVIEIIVTIIATPLMIWLAWRGAALWALLAGEVVGVGVTMLMLYGWRPVWKPKFSLDRHVMSYYFNFGKRNFLNAILNHSLDRLDDIWVGTFLGETAMGFYSKAYSLATYPRKILANPINWVIGGAFAELKGKRNSLSRLFRLVNLVLVRSSFFLAGLLAWIAPEFIEVFLGEKWLPMLTVFRLMLVFTLFDPMKLMIASVISLAGGEPQIVVKARLYQLATMILGILILGPLLGINGVAIAVNMMLVAGIVILLFKVRIFVDYSIKEIFVVPLIALLLSSAAVFSWRMLVNMPSSSDLILMLFKAVLFSVVYLLILILFEHKKMEEIVSYIRDIIKNQ